jgi:hypothetical protein
MGSLRLSDEVEERKEVDPHEVDEVPVEGSEVDGREVLPGELARDVLDENPA